MIGPGRDRWKPKARTTSAEAQSEPHPQTEVLEALRTVDLGTGVPKSLRPTPVELALQHVEHREVDARQLLEDARAAYLLRLVPRAEPTAEDGVPDRCGAQLPQSPQAAEAHARGTGP